MPKTKIGFNQVDKPAPLWFRRLSNAIVLCFIPMVTGIIQSIDMTDETRNYYMIGLVALPFFMKGLGIILGNGQIYSPSNQVIDNKK